MPLILLNPYQIFHVTPGVADCTGDPNLHRRPQLGQRGAIAAHEQRGSREQIC